MDHGRRDRGAQLQVLVHVSPRPKVQSKTFLMQPLHDSCSFSSRVHLLDVVYGHKVSPSLNEVSKDPLNLWMTRTESTSRRSNSVGPSLGFSCCGRWSFLARTGLTLPVPTGFSLCRQLDHLCVNALDKSGTPSLKKTPARHTWRREAIASHTRSVG